MSLRHSDQTDHHNDGTRKCQSKPRTTRRVVICPSHVEMWPVPETSHQAGATTIDPDGATTGADPWDGPIGCRRVASCLSSPSVGRPPVNVIGTPRKSGRVESFDSDVEHERLAWLMTNKSPGATPGSDTNILPGCKSAVRQPALDAGSRKFESSHPDHYPLNLEPFTLPPISICHSSLSGGMRMYAMPHPEHFANHRQKPETGVV